MHKIIPPFVLPAALFAIFTVASTPSRAALLVSENFNYPLGASLVGQNGGAGFGGAWFRHYSANADGVVVAPLTFSDYPVSGNAVLLSSQSPGNNKCINIRTISANFGPAPQTVWSSYLFSHTVTPGTSPAYYGGMSTQNNTYPDDTRNGLAGTNGSTKFLANYQSPGGSSSSASHSQGTTYLLVGKYTGGSNLVVWVLTAANYDAIKPGGITEAELNATNFAKMTDNFVSGDANTLQTYLLLYGSTFGTNSSIGVTIGAVKMGTTLADVTGGDPGPPVQESFAYPLGANIVGQNGGTGFSGAWLRRYSGNTDGTIVAGLTFSDYPVSGNAMQASTVRPGNSNASNIRPLGASFGAGPQTVWSSYLANFTVTPGSSPAYYAGLGTSNNSWPDDSRGSSSISNGNGQFGANYQSPGSTSSSGTLPAPSQTYLVIGKYEGGVRQKTWALTADEYDSLKAHGISEDELDVVHDPIASARVVDNFAAGEANTLQSYLGIGASTFGTNSAYAVTYDELKMGPTLASVAPANPPAPIPGDQPPPGNWALTFSEDFDSGVVLGSGTTAPGGLNWPFLRTPQNEWNVGMRWDSPINNEIQGYDWRNVAVADGVCRIKVEKRVCANIGMSGWIAGGEKQYASGVIQTYDRWTQAYGYMVARVKMVQARGTWPAFWLLPDRGPASPNVYHRTAVGDTWFDPGPQVGGSCPMGNEIDIFEYMATWKNPSTGLAKSHCGYFWSYGGGSVGVYNFINQLLNPDTTFHTYALRWAPGELTFYIDGHVVWKRRDASNIGVTPHYLIFNAAMTQNDWTGTTVPIENINADLAAPKYMEIDYVRVYADTTGATTAAFTSIGAEDGYIQESSETSNAGGTVNAGDSSAGAIRAGDLAGDLQVKGIVSFDTSSIPDGATIVAARLKLKRGTVAGTSPHGTHGNCRVDIKGGSGFGGATALAAGDFQAPPDATQVAFLSAAASDGAGAEALINTTGLELINKTGKTQFRLSFPTDDNDDNGDDYIGWYSGENATANNRPVLEVIYK